MKTTQNKQRGSNSAPCPCPVITEVPTPVVGIELSPKKATVQRGHGAATKGFTSNGPMG